MCSDLLALSTATLCIYIRSAFRLAELSNGFGGTLANDQTLFTVFEGVMVSSAVIALTIFHPGVALKGMRPQSNMNGSSESIEKLSPTRPSGDTEASLTDCSTRPLADSQVTLDVGSVPPAPKCSVDIQSIADEVVEYPSDVPASPRVRSLVADGQAVALRFFTASAQVIWVEASSPLDQLERRLPLELERGSKNVSPPAKRSSFVPLPF
jgi:hypothetical protein